MDRTAAKMDSQLDRLADALDDARVATLLRRAQHALRRGDRAGAQRWIDDAHRVALDPRPAAA